MPETEFPPYRTAHNQESFESRRSLPAELQMTLVDIEFALSNDPFQADNPDRITPDPEHADHFIYTHPDPEIQVTFKVDEEEKVLYFYHYSAPAFEVSKSIFISYAHENKKVLKELKIFLAGLEQKGMIQYWDDSMLEPGVPWEKQIEKVLDSAKAGLLLVSQEFLASEFINEKELPKLLEGAKWKGKKIFWVHVSPSTVFDTHEEITTFQSPMDNPMESLEEMKPSKRKKLWVKIISELRKAVESK